MAHYDRSFEEQVLGGNVDAFFIIDDIAFPQDISKIAECVNLELPQILKGNTLQVVLVGTLEIWKIKHQPDCKAF